MPVEEYKPAPFEIAVGDYPDFKELSADSKDPFYPYDFPELKRNFNEVVSFICRTFYE